jgi:hypothetical protein
MDRFDDRNEEEVNMQWNRRTRLYRYLVLTYLVFWLLLGATGALIALKVPDFVITVMKNVCAWTPTFVILLLFRKLYPGVTFRQYLRDKFGTRVNPLVFVLLFVIQAAILLLAVGAHSLTSRSSPGSLSLMGLAPFALAVLVTATSGPMGEELGWRGFVLNELQIRFSPFASALIVGVVWGFWHTPLWLISGYTGVQLAAYALCFMVGIMSVSMVMTVFYNRYRNILVAMWIHFLFNFLLLFTTLAALPLLAYTSVGYFVLTIALVIADRKSLFRKADRGSDLQEAPT